MNPTHQGDQRPQQDLRRRRGFFVCSCLSVILSSTELLRTKHPLVEAIYVRTKTDQTMDGNDARLTSDCNESFLLIGEVVFFDCSCSKDGS